jgi:hypothetical protein
MDYLDVDRARVHAGGARRSTASSSSGARRPVRAVEGSARTQRRPLIRAASKWS